jgi:RNA polymerase-binding protein DksA
MEHTMKTTTLAIPIEKLKSEQEKIRLKLSSQYQELRTQPDSRDFEDIASDLANHEMTLTQIKELEQQLKIIEHALQRVEQGIYGVCECCGESIDPSRLEIIPETTLCIQCKARSEQPRRMRTLAWA